MFLPIKGRGWYYYLRLVSRCACILTQPNMRDIESRAIGRYIAQKYAGQGTPLLPDPADLKVSTNQAGSSTIANE